MTRFAGPKGKYLWTQKSNRSKNSFQGAAAPGLIPRYAFERPWFERLPDAWNMKIGQKPHTDLPVR